MAVNQRTMSEERDWRQLLMDTGRIAKALESIAGSLQALTIDTEALADEAERGYNPSQIKPIKRRE